MVIFPTIAAFIPIQTLLPIVGTPLRLPLFVCPITTPLCILQLHPIFALGLIVILYACPKYKPPPNLIYRTKFQTSTSLQKSK